MNCPVCGERLREINRHSVDMDICTACKGIWLDKGELDKIIDLVSDGSNERYDNRESSIENRRKADAYRDSERNRYDDDHDYHDQGGYGRGKRRKREGLLGEIFDIFG